jgi:hypothetical protein
VRRLVASFLAWCVTLALTAPLALAGDEGEGLYGETNDLVVTMAGFILIAFFPLLVAVLSFVQWRLEKRKEARTQAKRTHLARSEWRGGW